MDPFFAKADNSDKKAEMGEFTDLLEYQGSYKNGKKNGIFKAKFHYDDSVDLYHNYKVTITFDEDKCVSGTFSGSMGHVMPVTKYKFGKLGECSFGWIADTAWSKWRKDSESQKK